MDLNFENAREAINTDIRPMIEMDGGRIELTRLEDDTIYVRLSGACSHCPALELTLKGGIERILKMKFSTLKAVLTEQ